MPLGGFEPPIITLLNNYESDVLTWLNYSGKLELKSL